MSDSDGQDWENRGGEVPRKKAAKTAVTKTRGSKKVEAKATLGFEAQLWQAADLMRNNMDPAESKHVVLGLLFLKYISDAFEERRDFLRFAVADKKSDYFVKEKKREAELRELLEDRDEYTAENVFWVPKDSRWSQLWAKAKLLLCVAVTLGAAGCSPDAKVSGEVAGVDVSLSHGKAESLASGGSGRVLALRDYGAECNGPAEAEDHVLLVTLEMNGTNVPSEVPPGEYYVGNHDLDGFVVSLSSSFQVNGSGEFQLATSGSVEIESSSADGYSGTLDLEFDDGGSLSGPFDLQTCERP